MNTPSKSGGADVMSMYGLKSNSNSSPIKDDNYNRTEAKIAAMKAAGMKAKTPRKDGPPKSEVIC